jgi:5'-nucleotidase
MQYNHSMTRILLTNDDGIDSAGLTVLRRALDGFGDVVTIAPAQNHSAVARSITIDRNLHIERRRFGDGFDGFAVDGTPVDCVRVAVVGVVAEAPDIVVAGVNIGGNMGADVTYSGTVGAALEGALRGLPGVAVSIDAREPRYLDEMTAVISAVLAEVFARGLPEQTVLNVNLPDVPAAQIKGVRVTQLGGASCSDRFSLDGDDGYDGEYRVTCERLADAAWPHNDFEAVAEGFVSLTPLRPRYVDDAAFVELSHWTFARLAGARRGAATDR